MLAPNRHDLFMFKAFMIAYLLRLIITGFSSSSSAVGLFSGSWKRWMTGHSLNNISNHEIYSKLPAPACFWNCDKDIEAVIKLNLTNLIKTGVHHLNELLRINTRINLHCPVPLHNLHTEVQGILRREKWNNLKKLENVPRKISYRSMLFFHSAWFKRYHHSIWIWDISKGLQKYTEQHWHPESFWPRILTVI